MAPGGTDAAVEPLAGKGAGAPQPPRPRPPHLRQVRGSVGLPRRRPVRLRRRQKERQRGGAGVPRPGQESANEACSQLSIRWSRHSKSISQCIFLIDIIVLLLLVTSFLSSAGIQNRQLVNNPIPSNLKSEAKKAAKILREFTEITSRNGPDKIIPPHVIAKAKGLAVLSVIKAGFLVTARGGSGIVLARLPNGTWSAPSAIGIAGLGGGFEIGIEVSDLVIILNHERAVEAFAKGGNLTLGGNLTVAIGPLGRNLEGDVALRSSAAVYTYCKSRGLFAGVSLEGTCLIERKETNRKFYGQDIRASAILLGDVPFPAQANDLYEILASFTEVYENEEQKNNPGKSVREQRRVNDPPARPSSRPEPPKPTVRPTPPAKKNTNKLYPELPNDYASVDNSRSDPVEVTALYSFEGQQPGDLTFKAGDKITVTTKTNSQFDWWEGRIGGKTGIFPANYVAISNN